MTDCKQQILATIPISNCCGHTFLQTLLSTSSNVNETGSALFVFAKLPVLEKAVKIIKNFHPNIQVNLFEGSMCLHGNLFELQAEADFSLKQISSECDRLTTLKTLFLLFGALYYNENPLKNSTGYQLEFVLKDENIVEMLSELLGEFSIKLTKSLRNKSHVFYTKNSNTVCEIMVKLGATKCALDIQNNLAMREIKNSSNRQNNCFEGNLEKTLDASTQQITAINYILEHDSLDLLTDSLREVALARLANPDISLSALQQILGGGISRAGIKYRLDKIIEIYKRLKGENA